MEFLNEGISRKETKISGDNLPTRPLKISDKDTFSELSKEFTFFTPALLTLYGVLPFDAVTQFYQLNNLTEKPYAILTDEAIFSGLESNHTAELFNHFLMAVENKLWKELALHLGTLGSLDKDKKLYIGTEIQQLDMVDYLALRRHSILPIKLPMFKVYAVALDGNKTCLQFIPATNPPIGKISLVRTSPRSNVIEYANTLFGTPK